MQTEAKGADRAETFTLWALVTAILGLATLALLYWLVLPPVLLGLAGVLLGVFARRRSASARNRERASVAIALGAVAMLFTPVVLAQTSAAEDWGRDCALHPEQDANCPQAP